MAVAEAARNYLQNPDLERFLRLREEVFAAGQYSPHINYESVAQPLFAQGQYRDVVAALTTMLPGGILSFGLHSMLAYAHQQLGATEDAQREAFYARAIMHGILLTGDGSQEQPYLVLYISDEYDVIRHLGKESVRTNTYRQNDKLLDQHICSDGSIIWFGLATSLVPRTAGTMA